MDLGKVMTIWKGDYSASVQYKINDGVTYQDSAYVTKAVPPIGTVPTNTTYWQLMARVGTAVTAAAQAAAQSAQNSEVSSQNSATSAARAEQAAVDASTKGGTPIYVNNVLQSRTDVTSDIQTQFNNRKIHSYTALSQLTNQETGLPFNDAEDFDPIDLESNLGKIMAAMIAAGSAAELLFVIGTAQYPTLAKSFTGINGIRYNITPENPGVGITVKITAGANYTSTTPSIIWTNTVEVFGDNFDNHWVGVYDGSSTTKWKGLKPQNAVSYKSLIQVGILDSDLSPTDFTSNLTVIINKLKGLSTYVIPELTVAATSGSAPNLRQSIANEVGDSTAFAYTLKISIPPNNNIAFPNPSSAISVNVELWKTATTISNKCWRGTYASEIWYGFIPELLRDVLYDSSTLLTPGKTFTIDNITKYSRLRLYVNFYSYQQMQIFEISTISTSSYRSATTDSGLTYSIALSITGNELEVMDIVSIGTDGYISQMASAGIRKIEGIY